MKYFQAGLEYDITTAVLAKRGRGSWNWDAERRPFLTNSGGY